MRRLLVFVRDKLGDSVIAFQTLLSYRDAHPDDDITVVVHGHYLPLFIREAGFKFVAYRSFYLAYLWAVAQRFLGRRYDALVVLRGFGPKIVKLSRLIAADRKIHSHNRVPAVFPDSPPPFLPQERQINTHIAPSMRALRMLDPQLKDPVRLNFPVLSSMRQRQEAVVVCPISDEVRRSLTVQDVNMMLPALRKRFPGLSVRVLVRYPKENGFESCAFQDCEVRAFRDIVGMLKELAVAGAYVGVDTGIYHVAAAMGVPSIVFFGPSMPHIVVLPEQQTESVRLPEVSGRFCENEACRNPICIKRAVRAWIGDARTEQDTPPENCLLTS